MAFRRAAAFAFFVTGGAWSSAARAHGPAPAIVSVTAAAEGSPVVLAISEGLAQRRDGRLHFVCPVQFGSEPSPPALSVDGARTVIVGTDDLFSLLPDGTVKAEGRPELSRSRVLGLGAVNDALYAYRLEDGEAQIVPLDPPGAEPIRKDDGPYDSFSPADGAIWASRVEGARARVIRIDVNDRSTEERSFAVDEGSIIGRVVEREGVLYAGVLSGTFAGSVVRASAEGVTVLVEASAAVQGPVLVETGQVFTTAEAELVELSTGAPSRIAGTDVSCLGRLGDLSYLCSRTKLWSLSATGPTAVLADLADLKPPDLERVAPGKRGDCELQWRVFQGDLRAAGVIAPPGSEDAGAGDEGGASPAGASSGGCAAAAHPRGTASWAVAAGIAAMTLLGRRLRSGATPAHPAAARERRCPGT